MKEKLLENKKKVLENLYLTVFAVFCLYFFMWTTTFWVSWPDFFVSDLRTVMIALIVVKASVSEKKSNWKELVFEIGSKKQKWTRNSAGYIAFDFGSQRNRVRKVDSCVYRDDRNRIVCNHRSLFAGNH